MKAGLWPLVLVFLCGALAYLYVQYIAEMPSAPSLQAAQAPGGKIASISVPYAPIVGEPVVVFASLGACPESPISIYVDGNEMDYELDMTQKLASVKIIAKAGGNKVELKGISPACSLEYEIIPRARECPEGQNSSCILEGGCEGVRTCVGGVYSPCSRKPEICKPYKRVACAIDSCSMGYSACNSCGSAWGPCLPE